MAMGLLDIFKPSNHCRSNIGMVHILPHPAGQPAKGTLHAKKAPPPPLCAFLYILCLCLSTKLLLFLHCAILALLRRWIGQVSHTLPPVTLPR